MDGSIVRQALPFCLEMYLALSLYLQPLRLRERFWLRMAASALCFALALLVYGFAVRAFGSIWFVLVFLLAVGMARFCCLISWTDALYAAALAYDTQHIASTLYILLAFRGSVPQWSNALYIVVDLLVFAAVYLLFSRRLPEQGEYRVTATTAVMLSVLVLFTALFLSTFCKKAVDASALVQGGSGYYIALFRGSLLFDLLASFLLLWSQWMRRRETTASKALEKSRVLWRQNERQYALSRENVELINRKCHDLRHQIAALSYAEGGSERRQAFVREVQDMLDVYDSKTDTGNEALNTILMEKGLYCKLHDIQWTCVADGSILSFMDVVDLYTLFGNAIDNAIECVERFEDKDKRIISASVWRKDAFAIIQVENYFEGSLVLRDGLPLTSKGDTSSHGFGLKSMRRIAEKYQGTLSVKAEDNSFLLYVMLPIAE